MKKSVTLNAEETNYFFLILRDLKSTIEEKIVTCTIDLNIELEKILYLNDLIEVSWDEFDQKLYKNNKEIYLERADMFYSIYMRALNDYTLELEHVEELLKKLTI